MVRIKRTARTHTTSPHMIGMQIKIDARLQMTVASNCSNFMSSDLKMKPKTALNRAEVDESNETSRNNTVGMIPKLLQKVTSFEAFLEIWWVFICTLIIQTPKKELHTVPNATRHNDTKQSEQTHQQKPNIPTETKHTNKNQTYQQKTNIPTPRKQTNKRTRRTTSKVVQTTHHSTRHS